MPSTDPFSRDPGVVLVGLPGSGKTVVGACLAARLGRAFVDLDDLVERRTGLRPAEHIERHGEAGFREAESEAVREAVARQGSVISTGGGTVLDPLNRSRLWRHGVPVWLDAPDPVLLDRLHADLATRPLLASDPSARLAALRAAREAFYRAADVRVDASGPVNAVTDRVLERLEEDLGGQETERAHGRRLFDAEVPRHHPVGPERARVVFGRELDRETIGSILEAFAGSMPSVIADRRAAAALPGLLAAFPAARSLTIEGGERSKRLAPLARILGWLAARGAERGDPVIAFGGGTTGDLVGFAAALYVRGVPLVQVPTTWLAQADSALGGKVGIDLPTAKNAVGSIWPASAVVSDVAALRTLAPDRLRDGLAESLKAGLIGDPGLWRLVEDRGAAALEGDEEARYAITERAARVKLAIVDRDPYESGERRTLNLGHTLGHALEVESRFRLPHGQAVALGLRAVAHVALARGADADLPDRIDALLARLGFTLRRSFDPNGVRRALEGDKKRRQGRQRWILPMAVGRVVEVDDVTETELDGALSVIVENSAP